MSLMVSTTLIDSFICVCYKGINSAFYATEFVIYGCHPKVEEKLRKLDLQSTASIITSVIKEHEHVIDRFESLKCAVVHVREAIQTIEHFLLEIKTVIDKYNASYFKYWSLPNCDSLLTELEFTSQQLDKRSSQLIKLLKLYSQKDMCDFGRTNKLLDLND